MKEKPLNKYLELLKNTGALAVGNFSSKLLVFLLIPLYTNVLTTSEYGLYDICITTVQLLIPIFTLNVTDGVLRFSLENRDNVSRVFQIALKFILLGIIPASLIIILNWVCEFSSDLSTYGLYVLSYYIAYMFNQLFLQFAKGIDKVSIMAISGFIGTLVTVFGCIIFLIILKTGLKGFFIANILGQFIPALYLIISLKLWNYIKIDDGVDHNPIQIRMLAYSIPLIMSTIGWWLNNTSDRYIITAMMGADANGLLSIAYKIPSILSILYGIFIQAWQISAMKEYGKTGSTEFYNNTFIILNISTYIAASGLILLTRPLAYVAFAKEFYNAWVFVPFLVIGAVFTASSGYVAPILTSAYKTWAVAKSTVIGGLINIVLNFVLLFSLGNIGVGVATMISSFVILYMRYRFAGGLITCESFSSACILWGLLCGQAILEVYKLEYIQIPIIVFALFLNRKEMKSAFYSLSNIVWRRSV